MHLGAEGEVMTKAGSNGRRDRHRRNHVISYKAIRDFCDAHPGDEAAPVALEAWYKDVSRSEWTKFADVRAAYPHADQVGSLTVFNVGGNQNRVVCRIHFDSALILVRHVLTHAEYDKGKWKS